MTDADTAPNARHTQRHRTNMKPLSYCLAALFLLTVFSSVCFAQQGNRARNPEANWASDRSVQLRYAYVPRNLSRPGDFKVVVVPATNPRQARLDAQTYHIGWDALDAREGQSRVMYEVLLRKRPPRIPGTPPVTRPIPRG